MPEPQYVILTFLGDFTTHISYYNHNIFLKEVKVALPSFANEEIEVNRF